MTEPEIRLVGDATTIVGEAPLWSASGQALYWLATMQRRIIRWTERDKATAMRELPYRPSCLVPLPPEAGPGTFLVRCKKGTGLFEFATGHTVQLPLSGVDLGEVSFNDGAADAAGRLWIGTRAVCPWRGCARGWCCRTVSPSAPIAG